MYIFIALFTACATALWGWRKGLLHIVLRLSVVLLAYALAWQETPHLVSFLEEKAILSGVLVWPVAGLALFVGGSLIFSLTARGFVYVAPEQWHRGGKKMGALLGAVLGCAMSVLLIWTLGTLKDAWGLRAVQDGKAPAHQTETVAGNTKPTAIGVEQADTVVRKLSGEAMAVVAQRVLGDAPVAQAATQWVRQPVSVSAGLQRLASKPELRSLFQDPESFAVLVHGSPSDVFQSAHFQALITDADTMQFLSTMGLAGDTMPEQSQALAGMLSHYAKRFDTLRNTPEFQSLAQDPDLHATLQQGNLLALLTNDKVRHVAGLLTQDDTGMPDELPAAAVLLDHAQQLADAGKSAAIRPAAKHQAETLSKPLYRWKDASDRIHITEEKPPEGVKADVIPLR